MTAPFTHHPFNSWLLGWHHGKDPKNLIPALVLVLVMA
jgi:hypothetical protein